MKKFQALGRSLSKAEQKKVRGGEYCNINYGTQTTAILMRADATCAEQSAAANSYCVNLISSGTTAQCGYDCSCDGLGH